MKYMLAPVDDFEAELFDTIEDAQARARSLTDTVHACKGFAVIAVQGEVGRYERVSPIWTPASPAAQVLEAEEEYTSRGNRRITALATEDEIPF